MPALLCCAPAKSRLSIAAACLLPVRPRRCALAAFVRATFSATLLLASASTLMSILVSSRGDDLAHPLLSASTSMRLTLIFALFTVRRSVFRPQSLLLLLLLRSRQSFVAQPSREKSLPIIAISTMVSGLSTQNRTSLSNAYTLGVIRVRQPSPSPPPPPPPRQRVTKLETDIDINISHHDTDVDVRQRARSRSRPATRAQSRPRPRFYEEEENIHIDIDHNRVRIDEHASDTRRRAQSEVRRPAYDDEANYITSKIDSRGRMGEAFHGATKDWTIVDVPPGTERVQMDGVGGGGAEVTWQRYNGVRRAKFVPEREGTVVSSNSTSISDRDRGRDFDHHSHHDHELSVDVHIAGKGQGRERSRSRGPELVEEIRDRRISIRDGKQSSSKRDSDMWTEITKDLVIREAIEKRGYQYEETEFFFYVMSYLAYVSTHAFLGSYAIRC